MSNGSHSSVQLKSSTYLSKPTFHFAAGLLSGLTSSILLQPADLLKTRVQQSRETAALLPTIRSILASPHPIQGLWRGTLPSALRTGFGSALYFTSLNTLRTAVAADDPGYLFRGGHGSKPQNGNSPSGVSASSALPKLSHTANLITGAVARVAAGFVMMPVTVLKVRYESDYYAYRSLWGAAKDIVRHEGVRGLFAGFGATAIRDAPYAGLYVVFYEQSKRSLASLLGVSSPSARSTPTEQQKSPPSTASINFISGALAAGLATTITNPFDVVKTRVQLMPSKYKNMMRATALMLREDGMRSLFGGLGLRMGRKALSSALAWTVYEELIMWAEKRWAEEQRDVKGVL
ncbi:Mitochondrial carrier protein [Coccidioides posadasii C735 delta SOWgp]|uniref:Mitochondrial glycine transporter n=1 Tax=Coccidioides posadasii (strain C735) TaxID=222929 RepID=C5P5T4_COCP7|nr:Mitochondrial carrier protein [Coccidioides posadasii C735 delta SOWgp]EER28074.1 Mitochondrial carrier protein [Coccidioides posadasii C735 delta SOWgp]|eukprot:XP_003070219.1 Mitochondrial carrier protein [Coccidioides posadasii C735 delta SOWgp]